MRREETGQEAFFIELFNLTSQVIINLCLSCGHINEKNISSDNAMFRTLVRVLQRNTTNIDFNGTLLCCLMQWSLGSPTEATSYQRGENLIGAQSTRLHSSAVYYWKSRSFLESCWPSVNVGSLRKLVHYNISEGIQQWCQQKRWACQLEGRQAGKKQSCPSSSPLTSELPPEGAIYIQDRLYHLK